MSKNMELMEATKVVKAGKGPRKGVIWGIAAVGTALVGAAVALFCKSRHNEETDYVEDDEIVDEADYEEVE